MTEIHTSIVIPVYNEESNLPPLFERLMAVMDQLGQPYEVIFVNDGSRDRSFEILSGFHQQRPEQVRVIDFNGNFGQHMAITAAFERVRGQVVVTLDADLQNPPEEIPKLLAKFAEGYDNVGGHRRLRQDPFARRAASKVINFVREKTTNIKMDDQGCMLRAYSRRIVDAIADGGDHSTFIPALAYLYATRPTEIEVTHDERLSGSSKYSYYKLIRLNFDLITGVTLVPLQLFTLCGFLAAGGSLMFVLVLFFRRFIYPGASEAEGVFTLFAILFFLVSVAIVGIGLIGEYTGRIYQSSRNRPRFLVRKSLGSLRE